MCGGALKSKSDSWESIDADRVRSSVHDLVGASGSLLCELLPLDNHLNIVFLEPALIIVAPPHGPLVFASKPKVFACSAGWRTFVALFAS
jgi:hypothetical protein